MTLKSLKLNWVPLLIAILRLPNIIRNLKLSLYKYNNYTVRGKQRQNGSEASGSSPPLLCPWYQLIHPPTPPPLASLSQSLPLSIRNCPLKGKLGLPRWSSGKTSHSQCRGPRHHAWSGN